MELRFFNGWKVLDLGFNEMYKYIVKQVKVLVVSCIYYLPVKYDFLAFF